MGRAARTLIAATTDAVTTEAELEVYQDLTGIPVQVVADNLAGVEEVDIFVSVDGGTTWITLVDSVGTAIVLTATVPMQTIYGQGLYGFLKDATVGACGVYAFHKAF